MPNGFLGIVVQLLREGDKGEREGGREGGRGERGEREKERKGPKEDRKGEVK